MIYLVFLLVLLLTIIIEGLFIWLLYRRIDYLYYSFLANLLTNPALNLLLYLAVLHWGPVAYYPVLLFLELLVVIVEAFIYHLLCDLKLKTSFLLSLFLNSLSFLIGLLLNHLL